MDIEKSCISVFKGPKYFLGLMHGMHTDPKSGANLVCQCVTSWTRRHVTDLQSINRLAGRWSTSDCESSCFASHCFLRVLVAL